MEQQKSLSFQLLTLITTPKLAEQAEALFQRSHLPLQYQFHAEGTATSEVMDMLGLGSIDKTVLISMIPRQMASIMLDKLKTELQMQAVNSGIAFTIPLNGLSNLILKLLTQDQAENALQAEGKDDSTMAETKHVLVAAIVNRGFSGDVMEAAKGAGATGGTVIHSRLLTNEEASGFWGLSVQDEKEIVLILTPAENKVAIMQSIGTKCGMHSDAKGIVISLPIDAVTGI